ncbi:MAG: hypothetical protein LUP94_03455 [Candidatus Methanomethylicus sp.]|nr:hypothetical protein [Candidatus Methanomethylicus sp.]
MAVWLSNTSKSLIDEYFAKNGLETEIISAIEQLPEEMQCRIGGTCDYWNEKFCSKTSSIHKQNLLENAISWAVQKAKIRAQTDGKPLRTYLKMMMEELAIQDRLTWQLRAMEY